MGLGRRPLRWREKTAGWGWLLHPGGGSTRSGGYTGPAHHERGWAADEGCAEDGRVGDPPLRRRDGAAAGCMVAGACGSTRASERLRPGSPRTGAPPRQAWDRPLRPNQDRPFRWLRAGSPRTGFGGLLRHEAHGCPGCLSRPCPWVPTRGTPTVDGLTTNEGWEGPRLRAAWATSTSALTRLGGACHYRNEAVLGGELAVPFSRNPL